MPENKRDFREWFNPKTPLSWSKPYTFGDLRSAVHAGELEGLTVHWRSWTHAMVVYLRQLPAHVQAPASNFDSNAAGQRFILVGGVPTYELPEGFDVQAYFKRAVQDYATEEYADYIKAQTSAEFSHVLGEWFDGRMEDRSAFDLLWQHARSHRVEGARLVEAFAPGRNQTMAKPFDIACALPAACEDVATVHIVHVAIATMITDLQELLKEEV